MLYDLPEVIAGATPLLRELQVAERVRLAEGSFFDSVPGGGDAYALKHIIHDWDDDPSAQILRNVRSAAADGATLLLVEAVIPEDNSESLAKWTDMEMLLINSGRERTAGEYRRLLEQAGFRLTRVVGHRVAVQRHRSPRGLGPSRSVVAFCRLRVRIGAAGQVLRTVMGRREEGELRGAGTLECGVAVAQFRHDLRV